MNNNQEEDHQQQQQQYLAHAHHDYCLVRAPQGGRSASVCRVLRSSTATTTHSYALERVLIQHTAKGVTIFLASPITPEDSDSAYYRRHDGGGNGCHQVVIKAVPQPHRARVACVDNPLREIIALKRYLLQHPPHPHVINLLDCMQDGQLVYLVLPYLSGGDLFTKVRAAGDQCLPKPEVRRYFHHMVEGLLFMKQACRLAHRDVSLENVMLTGDQPADAKIIDLGLAVRVPEPPEGAGGVAPHPPEPVLLSGQPCHGKPGYLSPQAVREEALDPFAADVWSLGVCLYTMLTGRPLYRSPHDHAFRTMAEGGIRQVITVYESYDLRLSPHAMSLVCSMLQAEPRQRPTLEDIVDHPFFTTDTLLTDSPPPPPGGEEKAATPPRIGGGLGDDGEEEEGGGGEADDDDHHRQVVGAAGGGGEAAEGQPPAPPPPPQGQ